MAENKMDIPSILKVIGQQIQTCATGKLAYSEPVSFADRIIIPVAWVRYDFGGGGGAAGYARTANQGGGAGGQVSVAPAGIIEMTSTRTRFLPIPANKEILALIASSFGNQSGTNGHANGSSKPAADGKSRSQRKKPAGKKVAAKSTRSR